MNKSSLRQVHTSVHFTLFFRHLCVPFLSVSWNRQECSCFWNVCPFIFCTTQHLLSIWLLYNILIFWNKLVSWWFETKPLRISVRASVNKHGFLKSLTSPPVWKLCFGTEGPRFWSDRSVVVFFTCKISVLCYCGGFCFCRTVCSDGILLQYFLAVYF